MATALKSPSKALVVARSIAIDATLVVGSGLLIYGSWLVYAPASFIVAGVLLLSAGLNGTRQSVRR